MTIKDNLKIAILQLQKAKNAVQKCEIDASCWIGKDIELHIAELRGVLGAGSTWITVIYG